MLIRGLVGGAFIGALIAVNLAPTEIETRTVTEQVEVPGPTVTRTIQAPVADTCIRWYALLGEQHKVMMDYSHALSPQSENLTQVQVAILSEDPNLLNEVITTQNRVYNETTGFVRDIIENEPRLTDLHDRCLADTEDSDND